MIMDEFYLHYVVIMTVTIIPPDCKARIISTWRVLWVRVFTLDLNVASDRARTRELKVKYEKLKSFTGHTQERIDEPQLYYLGRMYLR